MTRPRGNMKAAMAAGTESPIVQVMLESPTGSELARRFPDLAQKSGPECLAKFRRSQLALNLRAQDWAYLTVCVPQGEGGLDLIMERSVVGPVGTVELLTALVGELAEAFSPSFFAWTDGGQTERERDRLEQAAATQTLIGDLRHLASFDACCMARQAALYRSRPLAHRAANLVARMRESEDPHVAEARLVTDVVRAVADVDTPTRYAIYQGLMKAAPESMKRPRVAGTSRRHRAKGERE